MVRIGNISLGSYPLILAPMDDISNAPFRKICREMGADLVITEFISAEALSRDVEKSLLKTSFSPEERPLGIQIFGNNAESMVKAAQIAQEAAPDFIDINWGCPVKKIASKGAGSGILNNIPLMVSITEAVVKSVSIPVSVKTRLGYDDQHKDILEIATRLQDTGIQALSIHGRTRAQMYRGTADWTLIAAVRNAPHIHIPVFGNGDIITPEQALRVKEAFPTDGMMVGRASIGNPWIFRQIKSAFSGQPIPVPDQTEKTAMCRRHLKELVEYKGERAALFEIRKHYAGYFKGIPDFKPWRVRLMNLNSYEETDDCLLAISDYCSRPTN